MSTRTSGSVTLVMFSQQHSSCLGCTAAATSCKYSSPTEPCVLNPCSRISCRCDPMPVLVLLLEGPRLSIHAAWTIYQNRVGYAPLTPVRGW